jgi:hypothetical protein
MADENFSAVELVAEAEAAGVRIDLDGDDIVLVAARQPSEELVDQITRSIPLLADLLRTRRAVKAKNQIVVDADGYPVLPEFLDRVKNPKPGDLPTYGWVTCYPSGGAIKK